MLTEGGEAKLNTNVNFFLEEYGVMVNPGECVRVCARMYESVYLN